MVLSVLSVEEIGREKIILADRCLEMNNHLEVPVATIWSQAALKNAGAYRLTWKRRLWFYTGLPDGQRRQYLPSMPGKTIRVVVPPIVDNPSSLHEHRLEVAVNAPIRLNVGAATRGCPLVSSQSDVERVRQLSRRKRRELILPKFIRIQHLSPLRVKV